MENISRDLIQNQNILIDLETSNGNKCYYYYIEEII